MVESQQRSHEGLGVSGHGIRFRSPRRRNLAHRKETQCLAEASIQPGAPEKRYENRKTGELNFISDFLQKDISEYSQPARAKAIGKKTTIETASMQALRKKQAAKRNGWTADFLTTYLHWLKWGDNRGSRVMANVDRNQKIARLMKWTTDMRYHDAFFPPGTHGVTEEDQNRALSESAGEVVRIVASTKNHIRRYITQTKNQQRSVRQKRSYSNPQCEPQKFQYLTTFRTVAQLPDSKGRITLEKLVYPNKESPNDLVNTAAERASVPATDAAARGSQDGQQTAPFKMSTVNFLSHPLPGCAPGNAFQEIFTQGLAQRSKLQKTSLDSVKNDFSANLKHTLRGFSLADPPQQSHSPRQQPDVLHKYVKKWNQRARRHVKVPSQPTEAYTLFDEDHADVGNFASKDVTADFCPAMLFEKSTEKENIYSSMASKTATIINRRLAFANWARTTDADVRLTDLQEWSGALAPDTTKVSHDSQRRVQWVNGPPYFGNGADVVIRDMADNQAFCRMENIQGLANIMAQFVTQEMVGKKFALLDEIDLPKPVFYRSSPPWMNFGNADGLAMWEADRTKPAK